MHRSPDHFAGPRLRGLRRVRLSYIAVILVVLTAIESGELIRNLAAQKADTELTFITSGNRLLNVDEHVSGARPSLQTAWARFAEAARGAVPSDQSAYADSVRRDVRDELRSMLIRGESTRAEILRKADVTDSIIDEFIGRHSIALTAQELGGRLDSCSYGVGRGAALSVWMPLRHCTADLSSVAA